LLVGEWFGICRVPIDCDKTDIYDLGVMLLEVVSGRPITSIYEVEIMKEQVIISSLNS
jgi:hypothetical protein